MQFTAIVLLALVALATAATYSQISQKTCKTNTCTTGCTNDGDFPTNKCLQSSSPGYYLTVNCSADGSSITEYVFQSKTCSGQAHSASLKTNTCTPVQGGFAEWACVAGGAKRFHVVKNE
eukprot:GILI01044933.1.p3 GENE.GILI01044933.1~~GILI01044933.1.p3  ORF type:complete len:129 (+),score=42.15 GILI01044933.1:30-389(+)